jgi:hypothetical protein
VDQAATDRDSWLARLIEDLPHTRVSGEVLVDRVIVPAADNPDELVIHVLLRDPTVGPTRYAFAFDTHDLFAYVQEAIEAFDSTIDKSSGATVVVLLLEESLATSSWSVDTVNHLEL